MKKKIKRQKIEVGKRITKHTPKKNLFKNSKMKKIYLYFLSKRKF